jgi:hypothetical protein
VLLYVCVCVRACVCVMYRVWTLAGVLEELLEDGIEEAVLLADNVYLTSLGTPLRDY